MRSIQKGSDQGPDLDIGHTQNGQKNPRPRSLQAKSGPIWHPMCCDIEQGLAIEFRAKQKSRCRDDKEQDYRRNVHGLGSEPRRPNSPDVATYRKHRGREQEAQAHGRATSRGKPCYAQYPNPE